MLPSASLEDIKDYQEKMEKGLIMPHVLPPCPRCEVESQFFKGHAYRERRFLVIVDMMVQACHCTLVRFRCPGCRKTFTVYPDFAIPHKHYTRQSIVGLAGNYVGTDNTYQEAVIDQEERSLPGYPEGDKSLAPSTIHRWITSLGGLMNTTREALSLIRQEDPASGIFRDLTTLVVPSSKYRTEARRGTLSSCFGLLLTEAIFQIMFKVSIFTKLATTWGFT